MPADAATDGAELARPVRWILTTAAVLVFLAGVQLFVYPTRTDRYFAWTIAPPMTAVFLGASYWSAVGLEIVAARQRRWARARIAIPAVFVFTTATLIVTLVHLDRFHLGSSFAGEARVVTYAWIVVYATVPVLMILAVLAQRRVGFAVPAPAGLPGPVRLTLVALSALLLGLGTVLLIWPDTGAEVWSWELTALTARAVGAWLLGLGVAAGHAFVIDDRDAIRPMAVTGLLFPVLQGWALVRYGDSVAASSSRAAYIAVLVVLFVLSAWVLWPSRSDDRR